MYSGPVYIVYITCTCSLFFFFPDCCVLTIIEFGISGIGAISVAGLACMHTWLIATMQTTNEDVSCMSHDMVTRSF